MRSRRCRVSAVADVVGVSLVSLSLSLTPSRRPGPALHALSVLLTRNEGGLQSTWSSVQPTIS